METLAYTGHEKDKRANAVGIFDKDQSFIAIEKTLDEPTRSVILVHEWLHAAWDVAGLPPSYEEKVVRLLAPVLAASMKVNPDLLNLFR